MDGEELVESVACELSAGRPAKALSILKSADPRLDPAELAELRFRTYLAVGRAEEVLGRLDELEASGGAPLSPELLQLFRGLAMWCLEENPRARALEILAPLRQDLEGRHRVLCERALAQLFLECGAPRLACDALEAARAAAPEAPDHAPVELLMALMRGDRKAAATLAAGRGLGARDRTRVAASQGDWTSVDIEIEALREVFLDDPEGLDELATYAERVGDHATARDALTGFEQAFAQLGNGPRRRYRLAVAELLAGDPRAARGRLEILGRGEDLVARAARSLRVALDGGAAPGERTRVRSLPHVEWPGVHSLPACLGVVLWRLGEEIDPHSLQRRIQAEDGDVLSAYEALDLLREEGFPFARFEADHDSLLRVLAADLPALLRLRLPGRGTGWALLQGYDAGLDTYQLAFPQHGVGLEVPRDVVEECQAPMGSSALVVGGRGEVRQILDLRLKSSMALEALDQAARAARQGRVSSALECLERAKGYRRGFLPLWRLLVELRVVSALTDPTEDDAAVLAFLDEAQEVWPDEPWPRLFRARYLLEARRDPAGALEVLEAAAAETRPSAELLTEVGDLQEEHGDLDGAAESWWMAQGVDPLYARPREQLSRHLRRRGRVACALAFCETARESSPDNPYNWEMRGILLSETGRPVEEIEEALRHAIELSPTRPYAHGFLADVLQRSGRVDEAVACLEEAVTRVRDPYPFLVRLAEVHFDQENFERTIEVAEQALEVAEEQPAGARPSPAVPLALVGAAHGRSGLLEGAQEYLERALREDPEDPWPVRELAIHLRNAGETRAALAVLDRGRDRIPDDVGIRAQRALTFEVEGDLPRALDAAREALELSGPDDLEVVRLVARLAHDMGQAAAADAVWRAAMASATRPVEARKQFLSFLLDVEDWPLAEKEGRVALAEAPDDEELCAWYGYALLRLGRGDDAIPWLRRSLKIAPEYVFARSILLDALTEEGEEEQAIEYYEGLRGLLTPLGYECVFVAYARKQRFERALQVARKACMAVPHASGFFRRRAARLLLDDLCEFNEALREAEAAVEADPDDFRNHEVHAWALVSLRDFEAAERAMDRMVETGAAEEDLFRFRRFLAQKRGDLACEEACARRLAEIYAAEPRTAAGWWIDAAALAAQQGAPDAVVREHLGRVELDAVEWGTAAARVVSAGRCDLAEELLEKAAEAPGPDMLLAKGELAARRGALEEALGWFEKLDAAFPADHRGAEQRAKVLLALGRVEEARDPAARAFERARSYCDTANWVYAVALLCGGDGAGAMAHFARAGELAWGDGPDLVRAFDHWAAGRPDEAERVLGAVLADASVSDLEKAVGRAAAAAAGIGPGAE